MPFKSEAQRRWMYANKPEMAKRWSKSYNDGGYVSYHSGGGQVGYGTMVAPPTARNKNVMQQIADGTINANVVLVQDTRWSAIKDLTPAIKGIFTGAEELVELPGLIGSWLGFDTKYDVDLTPQQVDDANAKALALAKTILTDYYGPTDGPAQAVRLFENTEFVGSFIDPLSIVGVAPKVVAKLSKFGKGLNDLGVLSGKGRKAADDYELQLSKQAEEQGFPVYQCKLAKNSGGIVALSEGGQGCAFYTPDGYVFETKRKLSDEEVQNFLDNFMGDEDWTGFHKTEWNDMRLDKADINAIKERFNDALSKGVDNLDPALAEEWKNAYVFDGGARFEIDRKSFDLISDLSPADYQKLREKFGTPDELERLAWEMTEEAKIELGIPDEMWEDKFRLFRATSGDVPDTGVSWTTDIEKATQWGPDIWMIELDANQLDDILFTSNIHQFQEYVLSPRVTHPPKRYYEGSLDYGDLQEAKAKGIDEELFEKAQKQADETGKPVEVCAVPKLKDGGLVSSGCATFYDGGVVYRADGTKSQQCMTVKPRGGQLKAVTIYVMDADGNVSEMPFNSLKEFAEQMGLSPSASKKKQGTLPDGRKWSKSGEFKDNRTSTGEVKVKDTTLKTDYLDPDDLTFNNLPNRALLPNQKDGMTPALKTSISRELRSILVDGAIREFNTLKATNKFEGDNMDAGGIWIGESGHRDWDMQRAVMAEVQTKVWDEMVEYLDQFKDKGSDFYNKCLQWAKKRTKWIWDNDDYPGQGEYSKHVDDIIAQSYEDYTLRVIKTNQQPSDDLIDFDVLLSGEKAENINPRTGMNSFIIDGLYHRGPLDITTVDPHSPDFWHTMATLGHVYNKLSSAEKDVALKALKELLKDVLSAKQLERLEGLLIRAGKSRMKQDQGNELVENAQRILFENRRAYAKGERKPHSDGESFRAKTLLEHEGLKFNPWVGNDYNNLVKYLAADEVYLVEFDLGGKHGYIDLFMTLDDAKERLRQLRLLADGWKRSKAKGKGKHYTREADKLEQLIAFKGNAVPQEQLAKLAERLYQNIGGVESLAFMDPKTIARLQELGVVAKPKNAGGLVAI